MVLAVADGSRATLLRREGDAFVVVDTWAYAVGGLGAVVEDLVPFIPWSGSPPPAVFFQLRVQDHAKAPCPGGRCPGSDHDYDYQESIDRLTFVFAADERRLDVAAVLRERSSRLTSGGSTETIFLEVGSAKPGAPPQRVPFDPATRRFAIGEPL